MTKMAHLRSARFVKVEISLRGPEARLHSAQERLSEGACMSVGHGKQRQRLHFPQVPIER